MIPLRQSVYRNLTRTNLAKVRAQGILVSRFQSSVTVPKVERVKHNQAKEAGETKAKAPANKSNGGNESKRRFPPINPKLRDVANQIREVVNNSTNSLNESVEILEEGLSYLREIQVAEKIPDRVLFHEFQPIVTELLHKAILAGDSTTSKSAEDVLNILVQYKVAHKYHFTLVAAHTLSAASTKIEGYHNILKLWVQHVEYEKAQDFFYSNPYVIKDAGIEFKGYHLVNLAYFSFVQSCLQEGIKFKAEDAYKLLQTEQLPPTFFVNRTLHDLNLLEQYSKEFNEFAKSLQTHSYENLDPNGSVAYKKINFASERKDFNALNRVYSELQDASKKSSTPITEATMTRLMKGFLDCDRPEEIFTIFQTLIKKGIEKPSISTWELVLRAMGHPTYINKKGSKRDVITKNVERTIETILSNDTALTAKTLSIIVSCFANLNRFDKVDEYLNRFGSAGEGQGSLPIISPTKNNILVGLILNKKVTEAETKLKEFMGDSSGYVPITQTMNTFLNFYARTKNYKAVEGILEFMKNHNIPEDVATYTIVIDIYFKLHREKGLNPDIDQILASITKSNSISLNDFTYTTLIDGLVRDGANLEAARKIFESASKKYKTSAQLYTSMLKGELDFGSIGNAEIIFEKYTKSISNDTRIWNQMITSLLAKHEDLALQYYENLKNQTSLKVEPNFFTYYYLIGHFVKRGNKEKIQYFIDELRNAKLESLGTELPKVLKGLTEEYTFSKELLGELSKHDR